MVGTTYDCIFRNHSQTIHFITYKKPGKKYTLIGGPGNISTYCLDTEYPQVYEDQLVSLKRMIECFTFKDFIIPTLGKELEPVSFVFEDFIRHRLKKDLEQFSNVFYLGNW